MDTKLNSSRPDQVLLPLFNIRYIPFLNYEEKSKNKQENQRNQHQC